MACNCGGCGGLSPCNQLGVSQNEVNTPNCTAQTGVNQSVCGGSAGQLCSCSNCGCQQSTQCVPTPYYLQSQGCQESHDRLLINQQWAMSAKALESFAIPRCDPPESVTITVPGLMQIMIGSYVQFVVGGVPIYLLVTAFDFASHRITLKNDACRYNVLTPGTVIPACSLFNIATIVPVPLSTLSSSYPYLAGDWTIPNIGACTDPLLLTTTVGLSAGQVVSIMGATYTVDTVYNSTEIKLCNNTGHGGVPGTSITAHDYAGNHIVPVVGLTTNACTNPTVTTGSLLVCHGGVQQPLAGSLDGQVPVLNHATGEVTFQNVPFETLPCVGLLAPCVSLAQGAVSGTLTFKVDDNDPAVIEVNDIVQVVKDGHTYQFEVTAAPVSAPANIVADLKAVDGVVGGAVPAPGVSFACVNGEDQLCLAPCCDQLQEQVDDINTTITNLTNTVNNNYTNIVNVQIPCAPKASYLGAFSDDEVLNIHSTSPNWHNFGDYLGVEAGYYYDAPWGSSGITITAPSAGVCDAGAPKYIVVVTGQIEAALDAFAKEIVSDGGSFTTTAMLNSVDIFLTSAGGAGALAIGYGDSAHLTWLSKDLHKDDNWDAGLGRYIGFALGSDHVTAPAGNYQAGDNFTAGVAGRTSFRFDNGSTGTVPSVGTNSAAAIWQHLQTYNEFDYFAAPFVIVRQCIPGEVLTLNWRYRAMAKRENNKDCRYETDPNWAVQHCEVRLAMYGHAYAMKHA